MVPGILDLGIDPTYVLFGVPSSHREQSTARVWKILLVIFGCHFLVITLVVIFWLSFSQLIVRFLFVWKRTRYQILPLRKMIFCFLQPNTFEG